MKRIPPKWAQAVCIVWPCAAIFELLSGFLTGSPLWIRYLEIPLIVFVALQAFILYGVARVRLFGYYWLSFCAGLYAIYTLTISLTYGVAEFVLALAGILAVIAGSVCILRLRDIDQDQSSLKLFSKKLAIGASLCLVVACGFTFASSYYCPAPKTGRLATREDVIGEWWGVKQNYMKDMPELSIQRLTFLPDGRGSVAYGYQLSYPPDAGTYWLMRGNRIHTSSMFTDAWSEQSFCAQLSEDGGTMTIVGKPLFRVQTYYKSDSVEGKRLVALGAKYLKEFNSRK